MRFPHRSFEIVACDSGETIETMIIRVSKRTPSDQESRCTIHVVPLATHQKQTRGHEEFEKVPTTQPDRAVHVVQLPSECRQGMAPVPAEIAQYIAKQDDCSPAMATICKANHNTRVSRWVGLTCTSRADASEPMSSRRSAKVGWGVLC
eukprot:SAG31_NODE_4963_length_2833_cov_1.932699_2_plen_149_part_00